MPKPKIHTRCPWVDLGKPDYVAFANPGIIRNRAKVKASIINARRFLAVQEEFGSFDAWRFVDGKPIQHALRTGKDYQPTTPESDALSKDLKARSFQFMGSTVVYAHMQATGMVNDHVESCFRCKAVKAMGKRKPTPTP